MPELKQEPTEEAKKLLINYISAERDLLNYLNTLEGEGEECKCTNPSEVVVISTTDDGEMASKYCLICGGDVAV